MRSNITRVAIPFHLELGKSQRAVANCAADIKRADDDMTRHVRVNEATMLLYEPCTNYRPSYMREQQPSAAPS